MKIKGLGTVVEGIVVEDVTSGPFAAGVRLFAAGGEPIAVPALRDLRAGEVVKLWQPAPILLNVDGTGPEEGE